MVEIVLWGLGGKLGIEMLLLINQHKIVTYGHKGRRRSRHEVYVGIGMYSPEDCALYAQAFRY